MGRSKLYYKGGLSKGFAKAVSDYLLVETELAPADIGIVFGNNARKKTAQKMADLYHKGLVKKVIVSGGVKNGFSKTEAVDIHHRLINLGVKESDILIENQARHTGENVVYSRRLAARTLGLDNVNSIIAVGNISASRRFLMTLNKHWRGPVVMMAPVNPYGIDKAHWDKCYKFKKDVLREYGKIKPYKKQGFIREVNIKKINKNARRLRC